MYPKIVKCNVVFTPNGGRCGLPTGHKERHMLKMTAKSFKRLAYINKVRKKD